MKTKLAILAAVVLMITACTSSQMIARSNVSIYTEIPLAPNVVLTVESPMMASPGPDYVRIDGYWSWDYRYREYVWIQGYWTLAPYAGAFWIPGYWEYYRGGYRWIDARWLSRDYRFSYGYCSGRYDYYGRPVYYDRPRYTVYSGYAYAYDNRPEYRSKGYSSSSHFNNAPKTERNRITREYQQQTRTSAHPASTDRNRQETIRIREDNNSVNRESSATRSSNTEGTRNPVTTTPSRTPSSDNNRQSAGSNDNSLRNNESRSTESRSPSSSADSNRTKESNNSNSSNSSSNSNVSRGSSSSPSSNANSNVSRSSSSSSNSNSNTSRSSNSNSNSNSNSSRSSSSDSRSSSGNGRR